MSTAWIQLTAAVCGALAAGGMGRAFVSFLEKFRFCETVRLGADGDAPTGLRPTMGGLLLVFGTLCGMTLSGALCIGMGEADRTAFSVQEGITHTMQSFGYALLFAAAGLWLDIRRVRRSPLVRLPLPARAAAVFIPSWLLVLWQQRGEHVLDLTYFSWDAGVFFAPLCALMMTVLWFSAAALEEEPEGVGLTAGGVLLLSLAVLLLGKNRMFPALLSLSAAGACAGAMVWCLFPAKCRLGLTGRFWLAGILTALAGEMPLPMLLVTAAYLVNLLPCLFRSKTGGRTLLCRMGEGSALAVIGLFTGFAAFCGILAVVIEAKC